MMAAPQQPAAEHVGESFEFIRPPEAPVFEPTWEEFKDPMAFIDKIRPIVEKTGICKIRPPPSWQPPFAVDMETFCFTPRIQKLNELEAMARVKMNYLDMLTKFWYLQGIQLKVPLVERKHLDIYRLQKVVHEEGGYEEVCRQHKWILIARRMSYSNVKQVSSTLHTHYERLIYPYDLFIAQENSNKSSKDGSKLQPPLGGGGVSLISSGHTKMMMKRVVTSCHPPAVSLPSQTSEHTSIKQEPASVSPLKHSPGQLSVSTGGGASQSRLLSPRKHEQGSATGSKAKSPVARMRTLAASSSMSASTSKAGSSSGGKVDPFEFTDGEFVDNGGGDNKPELLGGWRIKSESGEGGKSEVKDVGGETGGVVGGSGESEGGESKSAVLKCFTSGTKIMIKTLKSEVEEGGDSKKKGRGRKSSSAGGRAVVEEQDDDKVETYFCEVCSGGGDEAKMLLCDGCDDAYHIYCLKPPLTEVPPGDWRCPKCIAKEYKKPVEAYGFEQAKDEYSIEQFGQMAEQFKRNHFEKMQARHPVPLDVVEREFWRLVSCFEENVSVEYGADIHAAEHGSGFPTERTRDRFSGDEEYIKSGWNLNNFPVQEASVLRHVQWNISGMKVPWCYVGMCFSSFAWHIEDHWSYSINYLHWGEPKTWYGVPSSKAELLEECMKKSAPELFDQSPDLLHQLTTLLNPNKLMKYGVPIVRTDQHAGEFVVTLPRAYHAGFNQGFNFAEAVNFCPADWLPMGRACMEHYREQKRECVFSHDELVCSIALKVKDIQPSLARYVHTDLMVAAHQEKEWRRYVNRRGVYKEERVELEKVDDDERQCVKCKTTCFLSAIKCSCSEKSRMVCSRHIDNLCACDVTRWGELRTLIYRYTIQELEDMVTELKERAEAPSKLMVKVNAVLSSNQSDQLNKPDLSEVKDLLTELIESDSSVTQGGGGVGGEERGSAVQKLVEPLRRVVEKAEKCVMDAGQIMRRKIQARQTGADGSSLNQRLTITELKDFCVRVDHLPCKIKEALLIQELLQNVHVFQAEAVNVLTAEQMPAVVKLNQMVEWGDSLDVDLPELPRLREMLAQSKWLHEVNVANGQHSKVTLPVLRKLILTGAPVAAAHSACQVIMSRLKVLLAVCEDLEQRASACLEMRPGIETLEAIVQESEAVSVSLPRVASLKELVVKARDWSAVAQEALSGEHGVHTDHVEQMLMEASRINVQLRLTEVLQNKLSDVERWRERLVQMYGVTATQSADCLLQVFFVRANNYLASNETNIRTLLLDCRKDALTPLLCTLESRVVQNILESRQTSMDELQRRCSGGGGGGVGGGVGGEMCRCGRGEAEHIHQCINCTDKYFADCMYIQPTATVDPLPDEVRSVSSVTYLCPLCTQQQQQQLNLPDLSCINTLADSFTRMGVCLAEGRVIRYFSDRATTWQTSARRTLESPEVSAALETLERIVSMSENLMMAGLFGEGKGESSAASTAEPAALFTARPATAASGESEDPSKNVTYKEFMTSKGRHVLPTLLNQSEQACTRLLSGLHVSDQTQSSLSDLLIEGLALSSAVDVEERHQISVLLYACWQHKLISKVRKKRHVVRRRKEMEEELKRRAEAEIKRKQAEEEELKRREAEEEELRKRIAEEAEQKKRKAEESERKKKEQAELKKRKQAEEAELKRRKQAEEAELKKKQAEEAEQRKKEAEMSKKRESEVKDRRNSKSMVGKKRKSSDDDDDDDNDDDSDDEGSGRGRGGRTRRGRPSLSGSSPNKSKKRKKSESSSSSESKSDDESDDKETSDDDDDDDDDDRGKRSSVSKKSAKPSVPVSRRGRKPSSLSSSAVKTDVKRLSGVKADDSPGVGRRGRGGGKGMGRGRGRGRGRGGGGRGGESEEGEELEEEPEASVDEEKKYEYCYASDCLRPSGPKVDWIQCDGCDEWYHMPCVGLTARDVTDDFEYICKICRIARRNIATEKSLRGKPPSSPSSSQSSEPPPPPGKRGRGRPPDSSKKPDKKNKNDDESDDDVRGGKKGGGIRGGAKAKTTKPAPVTDSDSSDVDTKSPPRSKLRTKPGSSGSDIKNKNKNSRVKPESSDSEEEEKSKPVSNKNRSADSSKTSSSASKTSNSGSSSRDSKTSSSGSTANNSKISSSGNSARDSKTSSSGSTVRDSKTSSSGNSAGNRNKRQSLEDLSKSSTSSDSESESSEDSNKKNKKKEVEKSKSFSRQKSDDRFSQNSDNTVKKSSSKTERTETMDSPAAEQRGRGNLLSSPLLSPRPLGSRTSSTSSGGGASQSKNGGAGGGISFGMTYAPWLSSSSSKTVAQRDGR